MSLSDPPRELSKELHTVLRWGSIGQLIGQSFVFLVTLALLFLLVVYDLGLSSLMAVVGESVRVESTIESVDDEYLPSGGQVRVCEALVKVNQTVLRIRGFGPKAESAKVGQKVTLVIPKQAPNQAYIDGFWRRAVSLPFLLEIAFLFYLPGLFLILFSGLKARRFHSILTEGKLIKADKVKSIPLPRPLKDRVLAKWSYDSGSKHFWCLQEAEPDSETVLCINGRAMLMEALPVEVQDEGFVTKGVTAKLRAIFARILVATHILLWAVFLTS